MSLPPKSPPCSPQEEKSPEIFETKAPIIRLEDIMEMAKVVEQEHESYNSRLNVLDKNSSSSLRIVNPDFEDGIVFKKTSSVRPIFQLRTPKAKLQTSHSRDTSDEELQEDAENEHMKERFAKLLLGEDMSGGGKGVSSALALSNAITNLAASAFGEQRRLEPMSEERKERWRREIGWLLSVTDHIVEFSPTQQINKDGSSIEVMTTRQRTDLVSNIPALRKLDEMLLECLDKFRDQNEFYYVTNDSSDSENGNCDKWWLPIAKVPSKGLSDKSKRFLLSQKDCVSQVLKSALAINAQVLSEMEIPESYIDSLPKNGKSTLGDTIYKLITIDVFDSEEFLLEVDLSSEHKVLDLKNKIEASLAIWRRKLGQKDSNKSSLMEKKQLEERAETVLLLIKQGYPGISQSTLDISKIQFNKDVGLAILESYSRVIESLAHTVISRIGDVLQADQLTHHPEKAVCKRYIMKEIESQEDEKSFCLLEERPRKAKSAVSLSEVMQWNMEIEPPKKEKSDAPFKESGKKLLTRVSSMIMANNKKSTSSYLESVGPTRSPTAGRYL